MVDASDVFKRAIGAMTSQVASAIHTFAVGCVWIGNEPLGAHARAEQVPPGNPCTGQVKLSSDARCDGL